jgi:hypothetical protein
MTAEDRNSGTRRGPLLGNGAVKISAAMKQHAIIEELLEVVFSMLSVPRL